MKKWIKFFAIALSFMFVASCTATTLCLVNVTFESEQNEESSPSTEDSDVSTTTPEEGSEANDEEDSSIVEGLTELGSDYWLGDSTYYSTSWDGSGTEDDPYLISSAEELAGLSYMVYSGMGTHSSNNYYIGVYFQQTDDIDISEHYWIPIGVEDDDDEINHYFCGIYDGNGHTVTGLNFSSFINEYYYLGLFGCVCGESDSSHASIHDLGVVGSTIKMSSCEYAGVIVGCLREYAYIYNCYNSCDVQGGSLGGIVGWLRGGCVFNCYNEGTMMSGYYNGGIASEISSGSIFDCYNTGLITGINDVQGGIVGSIEGGEIYRCWNYGDIEACSGGGGIAGVMCAGEIYECYNDAFVYVEQGSGAGGIVGSFYTNPSSKKIHDCYNLGIIECIGYYFGGIVGDAGGYSSSYFNYIYNCYNLGTIYGRENYGYSSGTGGGIVGYVSYCYIINCFNIGTINATYTELAEGTENIGGIVGYGLDSYIYYSHANISDIYGDYSGTAFVGCTYDSALSYHAKSKSWFEDGSNWHAQYAWDFDSVWAISAGLNDGYPVLKAQLGNFLEFDSVGGYWFFEDGKFPQSAVEDADLIANLEAYAVRNGESYAVGSESFSVWAYDGNEYVKVTADGANGTASDSDCTWFLVEPIVWIVAYGTADEVPTDISTAVSALVVTLGSYKASSSADVTYVSLYATTYANSMAAMSSGELSFSVTDSITYDLFNTTASQTAVYSVNLGNATSSNATVTSAGYRVASVNEIDALGGAYATECSDFVAFLLSGGSSSSGETYGAAAYWTRDLAYSLASDSYYGTAHGGKAYSYDGTYNQGVYVTSDGIISNATLKNVFGARLSVSL